MLRLPFKTEPRPKLISVGTEETGVLEIPKLGDLTVQERIFIKEATKEYPDAVMLGVNTAKAVAAKTNQKVFTVYQAVTGGNLEAIGEYLEEFVQLREQTNQVNAETEIARTTAIIKFRLLPEWTIENTRDPELISPGLLRAIAEFATKEENGWVEPEPITEADFEGKLTEPPVTPTPTGAGSSGESKDTGTEILASTEKTLEVSQPT